MKYLSIKLAKRSGEEKSGDETYRSLSSAAAEASANFAVAVASLSSERSKSSSNN